MSYAIVKDKTVTAFGLSSKEITRYPTDVTVEVTPTHKPIHTSREKVVEEMPVFVDDVLTEQWKVVSRDLAEMLIETERNLKISILTKFNEDFAYLTKGYDIGERESWTTQRDEAFSLLKDPTAEVPLLTKLAEVRGMDVLDLATKVSNKANEYNTAYGGILGVKHMLEAKVNAIINGDLSPEEKLNQLETFHMPISSIYQDKSLLDLL